MHSMYLSFLSSPIFIKIKFYSHLLAAIVDLA